MRASNVANITEDTWGKDYFTDAIVTTQCPEAVRTPFLPLKQ